MSKKPNQHHDTTSEAKKPCIACGANIPAKASICSVCKSYQASWKNIIQYFSGIAALIALAASLITWLLGNARPLVFPRDDVTIMAASTQTQVVLANRGDRDVFVAHLIFTMPGRNHDWIAPRISINEKLAPGEFLKRSFETGRLDGPGTEFVRGASAEDFEAMIVKAARSDPCHELVFFEKSDQSFAELSQAAGPTLNTFPVGGYLQYWSVGHKEPSYVLVNGFGIVKRCLPKT